MRTPYDVIIKPVISETSMDNAQVKKYTFKVATDANKTEVKKAVEEILYGMNESEVTSTQIGDAVLDELAGKNDVAYVRFASVYRQFKTLDEFESILAERKRRRESGKE